MAEEFDYYLPSEIIATIASYLCIKDKFHFGLCSKLHWESMQFYKVYGGKYGSIQLSIEQQSILEEMNLTDKPDIAVIAPPSTGKTIITLAHIFTKLYDHNGFNIIAAPTNCVSLWANEIKKIDENLIDKNDPSKSKVLVNNVNYPRHHKYIRESLFDNFINSGVKIIICSHIVMGKWFKDNSNDLSLFMGNINKIIIDEAHLTDSWDKWDIWDIIKGHNIKTVSLSASKINYIYYYYHNQISNKREKKINNNVKLIQRTHKIIEKVVPAHKTITPYIKLDKLLPNLFKSHDKIVIFISSNDKNKKIEYITSLIDEISNIKLFKFSGNIDTITKFHNYNQKALMLFTYKNGNVGHTINCSTVILSDSDTVGHIALHQTKARFLRITNKVDEVIYYEISDNPLKSKFANIIADDHRRSKPKYQSNGRYISRLNLGLVEKVAEILNIDPFKLSDTEFVHFIFPTTLLRLNRETFLTEGMYDLPYRKELIEIYKRLEKSLIHKC